MKVTYGAIVQRASGRFGGTVHSNWKGIDVVRRFAAPSNPNTTGQQHVRNVFANMTSLFQLLTTELIAAWAAYVAGKPFIARNKLIGLNVPRLQGQVDYSSMLLYPGDAGAQTTVTATVAGGAGTITGTYTVPAAPVGWTLVGAYLFAIQSQDPDGGVLPMSSMTLYEASDLVAPFTAPALAGMAADTYDCFSMLKWTAPDGSTRYSATPSAGQAVVV